MRKSTKGLMIFTVLFLLSLSLICLSANYEELKSGCEALAVIPGVGAAFALLIGLLAFCEKD